MKRVFVICLILLTLSTPTSFAATEAEIVASFKKFTSDEMSKALATYEGNFKVMYSNPDKLTKSTGGWFKTIDTLDSNYKVDVKRTESLISPYLGTLHAVKGSIFFVYYPTKEEAAKSATIWFKKEDQLLLSYAFQDNTWVLTSVRYKYNNDKYWSNEHEPQYFLPKREKIPLDQQTFWILRKPKYIDET